MRLSSTVNLDRKNRTLRSNRNERGASVLELLIVVVVIAIMAAFAFFSLTAQKTAYKTDDQALRIIDVLRAASLRAVTQRQTIRVEINLTTNVVRMIDENTPTVATDDVVVRSQTLESTNNVKVSAAPLNVTALPPTPSNFPVATYVASLHPSSAGNNVCTIRFSRNGTVLNAGANAVGAGAAITSTTLYVWPPQPTDALRATTTGAVRAITVFGSSGNIRLWKYKGTNFVLE